MEVWRGKEEGLEVAILNPAIILGSGFWNAVPMGFLIMYGGNLLSTLPEPMDL